jgi:hypothetical protein
VLIVRTAISAGKKLHRYTVSGRLDASRIADSAPARTITAQETEIAARSCRLLTISRLSLRIRFSRSRAGPAMNGS